MIGPAAAFEDDIELMVAFSSSSRSEVTSLWSDAELSPASLPDLEGSKLARIGFLTESEEDSEKLPPLAPPAQLPLSVLPPPPPSSTTATGVFTALSVGGCPSLSGGIGGPETCCCCCTPPAVGCTVAVSRSRGLVLAWSRTSASHLTSR